MLGQTTGDQRQALWDYGLNLGVAFQLVDDLLDYTADETVLGKPAASDLREGKVTLPVVHLLSRGVARGRELVEKIVRDREVASDEWRELRSLLSEHGAIEMAGARAQQYARRAKQALAGFPVSREREALEGLADYVLLRDR
jgi:octaprenyl-diphosphate synthase